MRHRILISGAAVGTLLLHAGCGKESPPPPPAADAGAGDSGKIVTGPPVIERVEPDPVYTGQDLSVIGTGFTNANGLLVRLGDLFLVPSSIAPTLVVVSVPTDAPLGDTGVRVIEGTQKSNVWSVVVENPPGAPYIQYLLPTGASTGNVVQAYGLFPLEAGATHFFVGTAEAEVWSAGPGGATFVVPTVAPGTYQVTAQANGYVSNAVDFEIF